MRNRTNKAEVIARVALNSLLLLLVVVWVIPYVFTLTSSFKPQSEIFRLPIRLLPESTFTGNYEFLVTQYPYLRWYMNTIVITAVQTTVSMFFCGIAGYAFAKYEFRFKKTLFMLVLISLMLPIQVLITPLFIQMARLQWLDTYRAVLIPFAVQPFFIFLMRQYMLSVPDDLLHSGRIDGCTELGIFVRIVAPIQRSAFAIVGILSFVAAWTSFLWPVIVLRSRNMYVLNVGIATMVGPYNVPYGAVLAASSLATIPIIVFFLLMQRNFIDGMTAGALKSA